MSEMITKNHALVAQFGDTLDRLMDGIENFVANSRPTKESDIERMLAANYREAFR